MSHPENVWAVAEELMSQNMLDVPIHIAAPVIAKVLASRAPATSEYERGRRDGLDGLNMLLKHYREINQRGFPKTAGREVHVLFEAYATFLRQLEMVAATSGTPTEMYLCEINHLILHSDQPYIFRKHPDCYGCNKYLAHGTPAEHKHENDCPSQPEKPPVYAQAAAPGPKCSHGVLMREFCQGCEDYGVPSDGAGAASHPLQDKPPAAPLCGKRIPETGLGCTLEPGHQGRHDVDVTKVSETPTPLAAAPSGKEPAPDWCDVCNASQMVVEDGEHVCGLTTYEAYSLGWRRGNNASHPLQDKPPGPKCSHGVLMREFCQGCEDYGVPSDGADREGMQ